MPTTIPVTASPHWTAWALPIALILITAFYAVQTWLLTKHAKAEVDEMVRQHREDREHRQRLACDAVTVELEQIQEACKKDRPEPLRLPTGAWDTYCGELAPRLQGQVRDLLGAYQAVRRCNACYDSCVATAGLRGVWTGRSKDWQNGAKKALEPVGKALEIVRTLNPAPHRRDTPPSA